MRKIRPDYYAFCSPEIGLGRQPGCPGWEITSTANVELDLGLASVAAFAVRPQFRLATPLGGIKITRLQAIGSGGTMVIWSLTGR